MYEAAEEWAYTTYSDDFDTLCRELLGRVLGHISGDATKYPVILELGVPEESSDDAAALGTSGTEHGENLLGSHCFV